MSYPKINSIFKRDMEKPGHPLIVGAFVSPETEALCNHSWTWTEKVDGMNIQVTFDTDGVPYFAGKTPKAILPPALATRLTDIFSRVSPHEIFEKPEVVTLYGEGYGGKIQSGTRYRDDEDFILFDVRVGPIWLLRNSVDNIAASLGIKSVPVVGTGTVWQAIDYVRTAPASQIDRCPPAEGVVIRPVGGLLTHIGRRIIEKVKVVDWRCPLLMTPDQRQVFV